MQDNYRKLKSTQEEFNKALKNNEQTRAKQIEKNLFTINSETGKSFEKLKNEYIKWYEGLSEHSCNYACAVYEWLKSHTWNSSTQETVPLETKKENS